jgi:hypothetical protein
MSRKVSSVLRSVAAALALATGGVAVGLSLLAPLVAEAKRAAKVEWTRVEIPESAASIRKVLPPLLTKAAKKADFGGRAEVKLTAKVTEFRSVAEGDVHRVSCTIVGRIAGGAAAKSRISFGGAPKDRDKLEKQVLEMVSRGVVARLAAIVRDEEQAKKR